MSLLGYDLGECTESEIKLITRLNVRQTLTFVRLARHDETREWRSRSKSTAAATGLAGAQDSRVHENGRDWLVKVEKRV